MHRDAASGLAEDRNVFRVAAERSDVVLHPFEGCDLIHVCIHSFKFVRMLFAKRWEGEETEAPQPVVESDQNDALPGKLLAGSAWRGATAHYECAAVDPYHYRQLSLWRRRRRPPKIEEQAILGRCWRDRIARARE